MRVSEQGIGSAGCNDNDLRCSATENVNETSYQPSVLLLFMLSGNKSMPGTTEMAMDASAVLGFPVWLPVNAPGVAQTGPESGSKGLLFELSSRGKSGASDPAVEGSYMPQTRGMLQAVRHQQYPL